MPVIVLGRLLKLLKGHFRFLIEFNWDGDDDDHAMQKFGEILALYRTEGRPGHKVLDGFETDSLQVYYITGERKLLVFGQVNADQANALQSFIGFVIHGSKIQAKVSHIQEANEIYEMFAQK